MAAPKKPVNMTELVVKTRHKRNENQSVFWSRLGVTQSGGSRYESGRRIPKPIVLLFELIYGKKPLTKLAKLREVTLDDLRESD